MNGNEIKCKCMNDLSTRLKWLCTCIFLSDDILTTALVVFFIIHVIILRSLRLNNFDTFTWNVIKVAFSSSLSTESWVYIKVAEQVCDTCASFTFFSKTLESSVARIGSKLATQTLFFLLVKVTYVPFHGNMNKYRQVFKIDFVYLSII